MVFQNALRWSNGLGADLVKVKHLGYPILMAAMVTFVGGVLLFLIDPNIRSPLDGVWSAWVTMTHVGFGDVVPASFFGRLLAAMLILIGLVLFSLFTASLSVALIGRSMDTLAPEVGRDASRIEREENRILEELTHLHRRLDTLEAHVRAHPAKTSERQF
jgi:voltage-gated potassium channel